MKRAEWAKNFWVKAAAFVLAVALVPVIAVNAVALICALEYGWWTGPADLYQTDFVQSAVYDRMNDVRNAYGAFGEEIFEEAWCADPARTNYRFALYDEDGTKLFDNLSAGGSVDLGITNTLNNGKGQIASGVAADMLAQDSIYWTFSVMQGMYNTFGGAVPRLIASALALLFLVIYLARVAGRKPDVEEAVAGWQEKLPFDLYLFIVGCGFGLLFAICQEFSYDFIGSLPYSAMVFLACAAAGMALLLAAWMTFCARVKLGKWWRNTVTFWVLSLCWRFLKWCWRVLRAMCRGVLELLRAVPLMWKTIVVLGAWCLSDFIWRLNYSYYFSPSRFLMWLLGRAVICLAVLYVVLQLKKLQAGGEALAAGDLDAKVDTSRMVWDLKRHGENLNDISRGLQLAVDKQLRSERLKTELITNVSHDIKTPLTSIINYVGLLRRDPAGEQAEEYLEVLDRQSQRLKKLTEDLVEVSKASTGNVAVNASRRSLNELLVQAIGEYSERLTRAQLDAVLTLPDRELFAWVDGTLLWRVLDNVFSNACKYALPGTRFYVDAAESAGMARLSFKNISRDRLNVPADELMERFVRGDSSRGGEGSGLGLNIAKSLTELQGGMFEVSVDGDLFRVDITFPTIQ